MDNNEQNDEGSFEIVKAELVESIYYDGSLIQPEFELHRLNTPAGRIYFIFENEEPIFFAGSGAIERELPKDEYLERSIAEKGWLQAERNKDMRMLAGSFLHSRYADLGMNGVIDFDVIPDMLGEYYANQHFYITQKEHYSLSREIMKDIVGIQRFILDCEVQFIGIEYPVFSKELQMATQLDGWCFLTTITGSGKNEVEERSMAIIDLKIGKWGHSIGHRYQLYSGLQMLREMYPQFADSKIRLFNLTGSKFKSLDWNRKTKPYKLTECTDDIDVLDYNHTLAKAINKMEGRLNKKFMYVTGKMGVKQDPRQFIVHKSIRDFVKEGDWQRFMQTAASIPETSLVL